MLARKRSSLGPVTTSADATTATHPRDHPAKFWRAQKPALASRGEVDGPRVAEAEAALSWHRKRAFLIGELAVSPERAEELMELIEAEAQTEGVSA
jgi:hypothetical protein